MRISIQRDRWPWKRVSRIRREDVKSKRSCADASSPALQPVTINVAKVYPFQVFLPAATTGLAIDSKAQAEQIRSVATERLRHRIGRVSTAELAQLDQALRLHLEL
jgi:mRNA-degrading endonuclease toxin of MazEF toxin-antitoxin module